MNQNGVVNSPVEVMVLWKRKIYADSVFFCRWEFVRKIGSASSQNTRGCSEEIHQPIVFQYL